MIEINCSEKDIEDVLANNLSHYFPKLRYVSRQYRTGVGIVDILAASKVDKGTFFVIEIKKDQLDANAYVQVLTYTKWLNNERSKDCKRKFISVIIGDSLSQNLDHLVGYFYDDSEFGLSELSGVNYRLYKFDPLRGLSFTYVSTSQEKTWEKYDVMACHFENEQVNHHFKESGLLQKIKELESRHESA